MHAPSRRLLLGLAFLVLLFAGCSQESDITAPQGPTDTLLEIKTAPAGYYDTVDDGTSAALRATLHDVIDDHTRIPYTSTATDTWNVLELADQDPDDANRILDVYLNASYQKYGEGNTDYNREHTWPKSYGFPDDLSSNYPYTDCHHLFLCNDSYNTSRSNKPYRYGSASDLEKPTEVNDGMGGGTGVYPGNSNWTSGSYTEGTWETWSGRRGDVARALLYMDVRYEGGTHGVTGHSEPDLILTDTESLIAASNTGSMESVAYMGMLSVLLEWHEQDPVDDRERDRNEAVYQYQGNRNPFIDHPEWVDCVFGGTCGGGGDTTPPAAPTGLTANAGDGSVSLDWADNGESDLALYTVYRGGASGGPYTSLGTPTSSSWIDGTAVNGVAYYYVVTASDGSGNESAWSAEVSATPQSGGSGGDPAAWINEFHYDNDSTDTGEFVEIAGTAGLDLSGWSVVAYNGNGGVVYDTETLSGVLPDQQAGFGTLSFAYAGMQNGSPDGLALVDDGGVVVEFLSYEGVITAVDGPAVGLTSTDVGVSEPSDSPVGWSLQLGGTGSASADFTWQAPQAETPGAVNAGQTFEGGAPVNQDPVAEANGPYAGDENAAIAFSSVGSTDADGTIVAWAWDFGDGGVSDQENPSYAYADPGSYAVTLTVTDDQGATDVDTASATVADVTPPAAPTGLAAAAGDGVVDLDWSDNGESDLDHYEVFRSTSSGGGYASLGVVSASAYSDGGVSNGTTYYYVVTAVDGAGNASAYGAEASATPMGAGGDPADVWINEFHYDNDGADKNEFVEVAGPAGTDLTGWTVVGYNGADGAVYDTKALSGVLADLQGGFGVAWVEFVGLQNGSPDGIALVDGAGVVVQFLSYEGVFTAVDGPAAGLTSDDIGIEEAVDAARRTSLQLVGTGETYLDFTWTGPLGKTDGEINDGQTFGTGGGDTTPPAAPTGLAATAGDGFVDLDWDDNGEPDLDVYTVYRAASAGGPYTDMGSVSTSAWTDGGATNGATYYYVVSASDITGNESDSSTEVSATPQGGGTATTVHVDDLTLSSEVVRNKEYAHADVLIVDDLGAPVVGATVTGTFTGSTPGVADGVTGSDGWVRLTSPKAGKPGISFGFCVDGVTGADLVYDEAANVVTCGSY